MRFHRQGRYEFKDTPLKRAAFFRKQRREREEHPLFAEQIAEEQAQRPGVDETMQQRAISFAESEQKWRDHRASKWREARAKLASYDDASRSVIRKFWNDAPYPADPVYLLGMLHDIERGRIRLDRPPPWRPTEEEIRRGRAAIARYSERLKAQSEERAR
jgi:hypothetical protein